MSTNRPLPPGSPSGFRPIPAVPNRAAAPPDPRGRRRPEAPPCAARVRVPKAAAPLAGGAGGGDWTLSDRSVAPLALTREELAKALRVSTRTLHDWIRKHGLPVVKIGGTTRFDPEAVRAWLASRSEGGER